MAIALWLLCACVAWLIGSKKGAPLLGLFLGLLLGPFGILAAIAVKGNRKQCPSCKEWIHNDARTCPRCTTDVSATRVSGLRKEVSSLTVVVVAGITVILLAAIWQSLDNSSNPGSQESPDQSRAGRTKVVASQHVMPSQPSPSGEVEQPLTAGCTPSGDNQCCGYIDKTGEWVIRPEFTTCYAFSEGLAAVQKGSQWGYIDKTGKLAFTLPANIDTPLGFSDGLAAVGPSDKCGFVDHSGRYVIPPTFDGCDSFSEGVAAVRKGPAGNIGFIDKSGNFVLNPTYSRFGDFSDGRAPEGDPKTFLMGYINREGEWVVPPQFVFAAPYSDGMALVAVGNLKNIGFLDATGTIAIGPRFENASSFSEGLAAVELGGKWGYIDKTGSFVIDPEFNYGYSFSEGLAAVNVGGEFGFIDKTGRIVIRPRFGVLSPKFVGGLAPVSVSASQR